MTDGAEHGGLPCALETGQRKANKMTDIAFSARCARCGNASIAEPNRLAFEAEMECEACGHSGTVAEFADVGTLDAMLKRMTAAARLVH
jgi:hypothetical protein